MTLVHLQPGQILNLEEASMYIVLDGSVRVATHEIYKLETTGQGLTSPKDLFKKKTGAAVAG